jgi:hypothetical protein
MLFPEPAGCASCVGLGKVRAHEAVTVAIPVYLLAVYPKGQQIDLTAEQKKRLTKLASDLKAEAKARRNTEPRRAVP